MSDQGKKSPQSMQEMILQGLASPVIDTRRQALSSVAEFQKSTAEIVHALEEVALFDPDPELRRDALRILNEPAHHAIHRKLSKLEPKTRLAIVKELDVWEQDGLISPDAHSVLRGRLGFTTIPSIQPAIQATHPRATPIQATHAPVPAVPQPVAQARQAAELEATGVEAPLQVEVAAARPHTNLGSVLFSETTINVALYLGAFFVLAAAFIVAALVEVARLPILGVVTIAAFGGAAVLARRLKSASFILFIIGSVLLLIDANVALQQYRFFSPYRRFRSIDLYWSGVLFASAVLWAAGGLWYRSRILVLGAYIALVFGANKFDSALAPTFHLPVLVGLAGAAASWFLQRKGLTRLLWPTFIASQLVQVRILLVFGDLFPRFNANPVPWLVQGGIWGAALLFYLLSDHILRTARIGFRATILTDLAATFSLVVFPFLLFGSIFPTLAQRTAFIWIEAAVLTVLYKVLQAGRLPGWNHFSPYLAFAGAMLFLVAAAQVYDSNPVWSLTALACAGLVYLLLVLRRFHVADWSLALVFLLLAYALAALNPRLLGRYELYTGYILLIPAVVFFGLWALTYRAGKSSAWWLPPLILTGTLAFPNINLSIYDFGTVETGTVFLVYALLLAVVAILAKAPLIAYGATSFVALAVVSFLYRQPASIPLYAATALAAAYSVAGWRLPSNAALQPWRAVLRWSGALLTAACVLASLSLEQLLPASIGLALMATISLIEALMLPEIRLGYLATASLAGSLAFLAAHFQVQTWSLPWMALAVTYSALGWYLRWRKQEGVTSRLTLDAAAVQGEQPPEELGQPAHAKNAFKALPVQLLADNWQSILRSSGWYLALLAALISADQSYPGAAIGFVLLAAISLVEAWLRNQSRFGYVATASVVVALRFTLLHIGNASWWQPFLVLASGYMLTGWVLTRTRREIPAGMEIVLRWSGAIVATLIALAALLLESLLAASAGFALLSIICTVEMLLQARANLGYGAAACLAAALGSSLAHFDYPLWSLPLIALGAIYILAAWAMRRSLRLSSYADGFTNSGMVLSGAASLVAPFQSSPVLVLVVAVAGALFAVESIRQRNVWLGFPTGGVWFLAYITALDVSNITEPQYFSIAAGALGVGMHFFLLRANQQRAAMLTGLFSLLTILSTTFFQLVTVEDVLFFWLIFIQSLLLLGYGLWVRSRTFVVVPILFSVLNVMVVTFSYLREFSTALTIGCTGVILLLGAILALLARERFQTAGGRIVQHLNQW